MSRGDPDLSMTPESREEAAKRMRDEFDSGAPGSAKSISDMHQRMANVHTAISNARKRIGTTPSTGSVEKPTEGTGFENLTEEQIRDLKYRRGGA